MRWLIVGAVCVMSTGWLVMDGAGMVRADDGAADEKQAAAVSRAPIDVRVDAKGLVRVTRVAADGKRKTLASGTLTRRSVEADHKVLQSVLTGLRPVTAPLALREVDGASMLTVAYDVDAATPWMYVQWLMQTSAHPDLKLYKQSFRIRGGQQVTNVNLPKDRGLRPMKELPKVVHKLRIKVFRKNKGVAEKAFTRVRIGNEKKNTFDLPHAATPDHDKVRAKVLASLRKRLRTMLADGTSKFGVAEIAALPPSGGAVPYRDIVRLVSEVRALGIESVLFSGTAPPLLLGR